MLGTIQLHFLVIVLEKIPSIDDIGKAAYDDSVKLEGFTCLH